MPAGNAWTPESDMDLLMAFINDEDGQGKSNPNWARIHERMTAWGYPYTKSSISQRFNGMTKKFRDRRGLTSSTTPTGSASSTPVKKRARATPKSAKGKAAKDIEGAGLPGGEEDDEEVVKKPAKKVKAEEQKPTVKDELSSDGEKSVQMDD